MKKIISLTLALTLLLSTMLCLPALSSAASKIPTTSISSLTPGVKSVTVKWYKKSVSGYQIQYSTSSSFKNAKKKNVDKSKKTTTKKIKDLKAKKKYYFRIRTYKLKDGKKVYSAWSKTKSVTTKAKTNKKSKIVYITPSGKKYHYSKSCAGKNAIEITLKDAKKTHSPCKTCANG